MLISNDHQSLARYQNYVTGHFIYFILFALGSGGQHFLLTSAALSRSAPDDTPLHCHSSAQWTSYSWCRWFWIMLTKESIQTTANATLTSCFNTVISGDFVSFYLYCASSVALVFILFKFYLSITFLSLSLTSAFGLVLLFDRPICNFLRFFKFHLFSSTLNFIKSQCYLIAFVVFIFNSCIRRKLFNFVHR